MSHLIFFWRGILMKNLVLSFLIVLLSIWVVGCSDSNCSITEGSSGQLTTITGKVVNPFFANAPVSDVEVTFTEGVKAGNNVITPKALTNSSGDFSIEVPASKSGTLNFNKHNYYAESIIITTDGKGQTVSLGNVDAAVILWSSSDEVSYLLQNLDTLEKFGDTPFEYCEFSVVSPDSNFIYLAIKMQNNYYIVRVNINTKEIILLAGTDYSAEYDKLPNAVSGDKAYFSEYIEGFGISPDGNTLYLTDSREIDEESDYQDSIIKITGISTAKQASDVMVYTIFTHVNDSFYGFLEFAPNNDDILYIQSQAPIVYKLTGVKSATSNIPAENLKPFILDNYEADKLSGDLKDVYWGGLNDFKIDSDGNTAYVSDHTTIRKITDINGENPQVTLIAGFPAIDRNLNMKAPVRPETGNGDVVYIYRPRIIMASDGDTLFFKNMYDSYYSNNLKKLTGVKEAKSASETMVSMVTGVFLSEYEEYLGEGEDDDRNTLKLNYANTALYIVKVFYGYDDEAETCKIMLGRIVAEEKN